MIEFVSLYGAPTQFRSQRKDDLWLTSGVAKLKQHQGSTPPHMQELRHA
jgi:hypothetical protein